jgi:histidine triad (HIT) family protein
MTYDPNNVFAKILRGELPCHKVHEDEHTLALMDIMPRGDGHTLVIPKNPARNLLDVDGRTISGTIPWRASADRARAKRR